MPTTALLDDFNRADEGPPPSANWTNLLLSADTAGFKVVSNQAASNAADLSGGASYWNAATFGPGFECYLTLGIVPTNGHIIELWAQVVNPGVPGATDGYRIRVNNSGGSMLWIMSRVDDSVATQLGSTATVAVNAGDQIVFRRPYGGGDLFALLARGGVETEVLSRSDNTYTAAGFVGVRSNDPLQTIDDVGAGTIDVQPTGDPPALPLPLRLQRLSARPLFPTIADPSAQPLPITDAPDAQQPLVMTLRLGTVPLYKRFEDPNPQALDYVPPVVVVDSAVDRAANY